MEEGLPRTAELLLRQRHRHSPPKSLLLRTRSPQRRFASLQIELMRCTHIDVQFTFRLIQTRDTTLVTSVAPHFSTTAHPTKRNTGKTVVQRQHREDCCIEATQGRLLLYDAKAPVCVFSPCVANQDVRASPGSKLPLLASSSE